MQITIQLRRAALGALAALAAGLIGLAAPDAGFAQAEPSPQAVPDEDKNVIDAAQAAFERGGYDALKPHMDALQVVLSHASPPAAGPNQVYCRARDLGEFLTCSAWARTRAKPGGQPMMVLWQSNTYRWASLLLGAYFNEVRLPDQALAALDKGLAASPLDPILSTEKGVALVQQRRFADAMALYRSVLGDDNFVPDRDRARLLRAEGFSLIELGKLDEAEAAYRESLMLEPDHKGAQGELEYIAQLRAGGDRRGMSFPSAAQSRAGDPGQ